MLIDCSTSSRFEPTSETPGNARPSQGEHRDETADTINNTLDGCVHHEVDRAGRGCATGPPHMARADALPRPGDLRDDGVCVAEAGHGRVATGWTSGDPVRRAIDGAEACRVGCWTGRPERRTGAGDLAQRSSGSDRARVCARVTLPLALADLGLIDEYEFLATGSSPDDGPTLLAGLHERIRRSSDRREFGRGGRW